MKEKLSIRIDPTIKKLMDKARAALQKKESKTMFIETAIDQRVNRIHNEEPE